MPGTVDEIRKIKLIPEEKTAALGMKYFGEQFVGPRPPLGENPQSLSSAFIVECLWKGVSGDADLFCRLFRGKYRYDSKGRTWFSWHNPFWKIVYIGEPWGDISSLTTVYEIELGRQLRRWDAMEAAERENYTALTITFARRYYALTTYTARRDKILRLAGKVLQCEISALRFTKKTGQEKSHDEKKR